MMKNIKFGMNSLKINTNMETPIFESKTPKSNLIQSRKSMYNTASPKKNYSSNVNHTPSYSSELASSNSKNHNNYEERKDRPVMVGTNNGMRPSSKSRGILSLAKKEMELDPTRLYMNSLSPKSTKNGMSNSTTHKSLLTSNKFHPLSTRNNTNASTTNKSTTNSNETQGQEMISVMSLLGSQNQCPLTLKNLSANIANYENTKYSIKSMDVIKAYAANTHQGIIR